MNNAEIYEKDPHTHSLLNQGVAKVTSGRSDTELKTLTYELTNFVCDGQYAEGLYRILNTYLSHLDKSEQPGVWVSGFFGSGKSHLVKMLQYLWTDFEFPDGAKARGVAKLPTRIKDALKELSTLAKRAGGLHAAAGTLGSGGTGSVRLELLGVIFKSVGLPEQYSRASFMIWLRDEGLEAAVRAFIEEGNGDFDRELANLYVSDLIARAILHARPGFASKPADVKQSFQKQFANVQNISLEEMLVKIRQAIGVKDRIPCTLIILDEVQQFIGEDASRSLAVQELQEQCCAGLGANLIFVATGQNALSGVPLLSRLQGRFPVTVELQDTDVEKVTREVVLKKKPTAEAGLKKLLDDHSGEIERQLANSKIAFTTHDRTLLVQDYPLLPVRRRFWERVLRAVDKAGTGAQLRTQLWIVYDAVQRTADASLGTVVGGAFLYEHIKTRVIQSGLLLQEISEKIARQVNEDDGELRYQICSLIFLISQLPNQGPADAGVRADADTLADLLTTDLTQSSAGLRKQVIDLLAKLLACGDIMQVDTEYRMQTREGSEWNQMFLEAKNRLLNDPGKLSLERSQLLQTQCSESMKKLKFMQGASKEPRKIEWHFGDMAPTAEGGVVPVWVRSGWDVEEKAVVADARAEGDSSALIYAHIPKRSAEELKQAIAGYYAATHTLERKGIPSGDEGIHARRAMETTRDQAQRTRDGLIMEILNEMQVYIAGGDPIAGISLTSKIQDAAASCFVRIYPRFHEADSADWHKVIARAKTDGDALAAVGYKGDPDNHPVCKAILDYVGSGKRGLDIRKHFGGVRFGWPQDAIDGALMVLFKTNHLQALTGTEPVGAGKLEPRIIASTDFRCETIKLDNVQLIGLRSLFKKIGLNTTTGQESAHAVKFLNELEKLADSAGGAAPQPKRPDTAHLADLLNRVGNDQLKAIFEQKSRLEQEIIEWKSNSDRIKERLPKWNQTLVLLNYASELPVAAEVQPEVTAIEHDRKLLANPDPVPGILAKLTDALRLAVNETHGQITTDHDNLLTNLTTDPAWVPLTPEQRYEILSQQRIRVLPTIAVGSTEEVLETLHQTKLSELKAMQDALPKRFQSAAETAAKLREPKARRVALPGATITSEAELQAWLVAAESRIRKQLQDGPVILG